LTTQNVSGHVSLDVRWWSFCECAHRRASQTI
jgi:hypothetical protein